MKHKRSLLAAIGGLTFISLASAGFWWSNAIPQLSAQADTNLPNNHLLLSPVHPDEPVDYTLNERFSVENSLEIIEQIKGALLSFQRLTEKSKPVLGEQAIVGVGNTDWETQNLGFSNWVGSVEGALRKQDYQMKKLEFEFAQKQYQDGEISQAILDEKESNYRRAEQEFKTFWDSFRVSD
ncbi:MAG TPA: hypothetical protein DCL61_33000 [Cyanobacteria bacterium UBA12227]|nr:hypothetical protein [Cyanobacteria bacterium UBA12227]HAX88140.1 hypothetical protein [Cyanobacteria bacterium UBA11370]HBY76297.1 hypothetical protein [Cyanobacteria bacterium UBA11148]